MTIKIMGFNNSIDFVEDYINILEIPNAKQYSNFVIKFNNVLQDAENNEIVLCDPNNNRLDFTKNAMLILDMLNINFNDKKIISEVYDLINNDLMLNNSIDSDYEEMILNIYNYLLRITTSLPFDISISNNVKINDLLKIFDFRIDSSGAESILENLLLFIDILSVLKPNMLLVLVNVKCFLVEKELIELYKYVLYKGVKILLLENKKQDILQYERKNILEDDYYDYVEFSK